MKIFAELVNHLGASTKTNDKLQALQDYFAVAEDADKVWVIAIFSGRRPKRMVNATQLAVWANELTHLPAWLFEECYHTVGDLAETIALVLPETKTAEQVDAHSLSYYLETFGAMQKSPEEEKKNFILQQWAVMDAAERFVFNKLITGGFRIGVSQKVMVNALAKFVKLPAATIAHRISGNWDPATTTFEQILSEEHAASDNSKPYPFCLAHALEAEPSSLGDVNDWQAEWKWDGIRGQIIKRNDELFVWSRGEELITDKFPEYAALQELLPAGVVLDGEILPYNGTMPMPFSVLQTRIGRKLVGKKQLTEAPVAFFAYDLLEYEGQDFRQQPLSLRRQKLEEIVEAVNHPVLKLSIVLKADDWNEWTELRRQSRDVGSEGLMLKRKSSAYHSGRKVGDWWKWKIDPLTIDAVLIYAQKGHGRRSNLYTDYTFAVKDGDKLVSFAKAYSGLTDKEFAQVDNFVKRNSIEKFGPVRTVKPELVFELAFEGIAASNRHKSGVALRFPRMLRWRQDKKAEDINTIEDLKKMLEVYGK
jgi:DNA ligase-1